MSSRAIEARTPVAHESWAEAGLKGMKGNRKKHSELDSTVAEFAACILVNVGRSFLSQITVLDCVHIESLVYWEELYVEV